jgi:hypothetical protein
MLQYLIIGKIFLREDTINYNSFSGNRNKKFDFMFWCHNKYVRLNAGRFQRAVARLMLLLTCTEANLGAGFTLRVCGNLG